MDIHQIISHICDANDVTPWSEDAKSRSNYLSELWDLLTSDLVVKGAIVIEYFSDHPKKPEAWIVKRLIGHFNPQYSGLDDDDLSYGLIKIANLCLGEDVWSYIVSFCNLRDQHRLKEAANMFTSQFPIPNMQEYLRAYLSPEVNLRWIAEQLGLTQFFRRLLWDPAITDSFDAKQLIAKWQPQIPYTITKKSSQGKPDIVEEITDETRVEYGLNDLPMVFLCDSVEYLLRISMLGLYLTGQDVITLSKVCRYTYRIIMNKRFLFGKNIFNRLALTGEMGHKFNQLYSSTFIFGALKRLFINTADYSHIVKIMRHLHCENLVVYEGLHMMLDHWGSSLAVVHRIGNESTDEEWHLDELPPLKLYVREKDVNVDLEYYYWFKSLLCNVFMWQNCHIHGETLSAALSNKRVKCVVIDNSDFFGPYSKLTHSNVGKYKTLILTHINDWWKLFEILGQNHIYERSVDHLYVKCNLASVNDMFLYFLDMLLETGGVNRWIKILFETDGNDYSKMAARKLLGDTAQNLSEQVIFRWIWNNFEQIKHDPSLKEVKFGIFNTQTPKNSLVVDITQISEIMEIWTAHQQWMKVIYDESTQSASTWVQEWNTFTQTIYDCCK